MNTNLRTAVFSLAFPLMLGTNAYAQEDVILNIPETYATLTDALPDVVEGCIIEFAPGTHELEGSDDLPCASFTIRGRGPAESTILIGTGLRFGSCQSTRFIENITLSEMTHYGAVEVRACVTVMDEVRLEDNSSHGFFITDGGHLEATSCLFAGNLARGGYAYVNGFLTAEDCEFIGNGYCECYGGGFAAHVGSGCMISNTLFKANNANAGGAIGLSFSGNRTFTNCLFEDNTANDGPIWWTEFGACGMLENSVLCGHSTSDLSGCWTDGGGNEFAPDGCIDPIINVPSDHPTIQEAVDAAVSGQTILIQSGTYTAKATQVILIEGKQLVLEGVTDENGETIIDGGNGRRCIRIKGSAADGTVLRNLTITNGRTLGNFDELSTGAGIYATGTRVVVEDCRITDNEADTHGGGAAFFVGAEVTMSSTLVSNNSASNDGSYQGGGVVIDGGVGSFADCLFIGNESRNNGRGGGLAIWNSSAVIESCQFQENDASNGGGLYIKTGSPTSVGNSAFCGNSSAISGGLTDLGGNCFTELCNDADGNGVIDGCQPPCTGDVNFDRVVDGIDLSRILGFWNSDASDYPQADVSGDGTVDGQDLALVLSNWGGCPE